MPSGVRTRKGRSVKQNGPVDCFAATGSRPLWRAAADRRIAEGDTRKPLMVYQNINTGSLKFQCYPVFFLAVFWKRGANMGQKSINNFHVADHFTISILHFLSDMHVDFFCSFAVRMTQASGYCLQRYACLCHHGCVGVSQAVRRKPAAKDSLCIFTKIFRVCVI